MDNPKLIAELNRIARIELGPPKRTGPKRHRHQWTSRNTLKRGVPVTFTCARVGCDKTKTVMFPELKPE